MLFPVLREADKMFHTHIAIPALPVSGVVLSKYCFFGSVGFPAVTAAAGAIYDRIFGKEHMAKLTRRPAFTAGATSSSTATRSCSGSRKK